MEDRRGKKDGEEKKDNLLADEKRSSCRDRPRLWIRICCCKLLLHTTFDSLHIAPSK